MHRASYLNQTSTPVKVYQLWVVPKFYTEDGLTDTQLQADLFTRHGLSTDKDASWANNSASILYDEPINSSKFALLKKKTFVLGTNTMAPQAPNTNSGTRSAYYQEKMWIPLNRKYTYGSLADGETEIRTLQPPVYWISWCAGLIDDQNTLPAAGTIKRQLHVATYFRDGESGM